MNDPGELLFGDFQRQMQREIEQACGMPAELLSNGPGLTATEILAKQREFESLMRPSSPRLRLIEDSIAVLPGPPVRTFARRRARSERHWARINKKWLKRYGITWIPTAYEMNLGHEIWIVVHPALAPQYRAAIDKLFPTRS